MKKSVEQKVESEKLSKTESKRKSLQAKELSSNSSSTPVLGEFQPMTNYEYESEVRKVFEGDKSTEQKQETVINNPFSRMFKGIFGKPKSKEQQEQQKQQREMHENAKKGKQETEKTIKRIKGKRNINTKKVRPRFKKFRQD